MRRLWMVQRWTTACSPNTLLMSAARALAPSTWRLVATPASTRSTTSELSRSAELKTFHVSRAISSPPVVQPRGRCVETGRPPSTTEPVVVPCRARPARRPPPWRASTRPDPPTRRSSSGPSSPARSPTRTPTRRLSPRRPPRPTPPSPPAAARRPGPPRCTAGDRSDPRVWRWSVRRTPRGPCRGAERGGSGLQPWENGPVGP